MSQDARLSTGFPGHPKTKKLVRRLGPGAGYALVCLILWARANRPDGDLSGMTVEDIELAADWAGENDAFVAALRDVGYLDGDEGSLILHDWAEHQPWAAGSEARSEKSRWAALCKQHGRSEAARMMPEYAERLRQASDGHASGKPVAPEKVPVAETGSAPSPSPLPSPSPEQKQDTPDGVSVAGKAADLAGPIPAKPSTPPCPHQAILDAYHATLPELPAVRVWTDDRQAMLRARWREAPERQSLDWWREFFAYVRRCPFLMGESPGRDGAPPFLADLEWLVRPKNFAKVVEGRYERRKAA